MTSLPGATFFAAIRPLFGDRLTQKQVDGINHLWATWAVHGDRDERKLAYILATVFHETAQTMEPVRETLASTDAKAKERLTKAWKAGKLPHVKRDYWSSGFFGRGYVQLTHAENYRKAQEKTGAGLVANPSLALDPDIAAVILIRGMMEGWFTGKKLGDYIYGSSAHYVGARRIVNGADRAVLISDHAEAFERAIAADHKAAPRSGSNDVDTPLNVPSANPTPKPSGLWGLIIAILNAIFGRKSP